MGRWKQLRDIEMEYLEVKESEGNKELGKINLTSQNKGVKIQNYFNEEV